MTLPGTGAIVASDDVSGVAFQRVKLDVGADGLSVPVEGALPVSLATAPLPTGASSAANQAAAAVLTGAVDETAPASDTASSGLNGRLQRIAQRITTQMARLPAALGQTTKDASLSVTLASNQEALPLPTGAATAANQTTAQASLTSLDTKLPAQGQALAAGSVPVVLPVAQVTTLTPPAAITGFATETTLGTRLTETDFDAKVGGLTETAPATDTASSGLNGRLQRLAQRLTSLLAVLPASLGQKAMTASLPVVVASDQSAVPVSGTVTANAGTGTLAVSAASLPLPAGAATLAKQPALGTAGTASADVLTVQGITSGTPLLVTSTPPSAAATPTRLVKTVAATGTPEAIAAASTFFQSATLIGNKAARTANTGTVYLGVTSADDAQFIAIPSAGLITVQAPAGQKFDLGSFYVDVLNAGDGVCVVYS